MALSFRFGSVSIMNHTIDFVSMRFLHCSIFTRTETYKLRKNYTLVPVHNMKLQAFKQANLNSRLGDYYLDRRVCWLPTINTCKSAGELTCSVVIFVEMIYSKTIGVSVSIYNPLLESDIYHTTSLTQIMARLISHVAIITINEGYICSIIDIYVNRC
jgi:hypothetical protein